MKRVVAVAAVAGLFLVGVVVGFLAAHLFYAERIERSGGLHGFAARSFEVGLDRRLRLTDEQWRRVSEILDRSREEAAALRQAMRPEVESILDAAAEEIDAILDPEQRRRFAQMRDENRRFAELMLLGPPGPPGGSGHRPPRGARWRQRPGVGPPFGSQPGPPPGPPTELRPDGPPGEPREEAPRRPPDGEGPPPDPPG